MPTVINNIVRIRDLHVIVWLHTADDPSNDDWEVACKRIDALRAREGLSHVRSFVVSDGGGPSVTQRKRLFVEAFAGHKIKIGAITSEFDSPIKHGMATAITWINPALRFVGPHHAMTAVKHLDLENDIPALWKHMLELQKGIAPIQSLMIVGHVLGMLSSVDPASR